LIFFNKFQLTILK